MLRIDPHVAFKNGLFHWLKNINVGSGIHQIYSWADENDLHALRMSDLL